MTAESSNDGEFETSTTTCAPLRTSANPSPVSVLTPVLGAAATASCPSALSLVMSFDPIRPVPPITTIFILFPPSFCATAAAATCLPFLIQREHLISQQRAMPDYALTYLS